VRLLIGGTSAGFTLACPEASLSADELSLLDERAGDCFCDVGDVLFVVLVVVGVVVVVCDYK
jgi:hypothetical protein